MDTAPIERLSEDVLCEMFLHCLPSPQWNITLSPKHAPVLLTHVCQRWRRIAIAFPILWTWLKIVFPLADLKDIDNLVPTEALKRSKMAPVHVQLILKQPPATSFTHPPFINQFLLPISQSLTRLALVQVPVAQVQTLPPGLFPSLERLYLRPVFQSFHADDIGFRGPLELKPIVAFRDATSLHHVAISRWILDSSEISILLPAGQITHFIVGPSMEDGDQSDCQFFLSHYLPNFINLRCLFLSLNFFGDILESLGDSVQATRMESVQSLFLDFWPERFDCPTLFNLFDFPNIRKLRLEGHSLDFFQTDWMHSVFLNKIRAMAHLEHLSLFASTIPKRSLSLLFTETPHLTVLDIHLPLSNRLEKDLLPLLTLGPDPEKHLLPRLRDLVLELSLLVEIKDTGIFSTFVESRVRQGHLERIVFYRTSESRRRMDDKPLIQSIQPFISEGLVILEQRTHAYEFGDWNGWVYRDSDLNDWLEAEAAIR